MECGGCGKVWGKGGEMTQHFGAAQKCTFKLSCCLQTAPLKAVLPCPSFCHAPRYKHQVSHARTA